MPGEARNSFGVPDRLAESRYIPGDFGGETVTHRALRTIGVAVFLLAGLSMVQGAPPGTTTFSENFEAGNNTGGWTFGNTSFETIEAAGGSPGAFLHNTFLDTFAAQPRTTLGVDSPFVGNYRVRGVSSLGIDLAIFSIDTTTQGRPLSVILYSDSGTPDDSSDDCRVHRVGGHPTPMPNGNWASYRFRVPSGNATLPQGWVVTGCAGRTDDEAWNQVISDVDQLRFFTGDPDLFFIFQVFDIGMDNPTIVYGTGDTGP